MKVRTICYGCALTVSLLAGCATEGEPSTSATPATAAETPGTGASCTDCGKTATPKTIDSTIAWRQDKEHDLLEAKAFATKAQAMRITISVRTARAQKRDDAFNKTEQLDTVRSVVLRPLALDKIAKNDGIWAEVIRQMGRHAALANAHEAQQIVVSITPRTKARVTQWINDGVASANNGQKPDIQVFETKQAKDTAIFYQPLDQKQFN